MGLRGWKDVTWLESGAQENFDLIKAALSDKPSRL